MLPGRITGTVLIRPIQLFGTIKNPASQNRQICRFGNAGVRILQVIPVNVVQTGRPQSAQRLHGVFDKQRTVGEQVLCQHACVFRTAVLSNTQYGDGFLRRMEPRLIK